MTPISNANFLCLNTFKHRTLQ